MVVTREQLNQIPEAYFKGDEHPIARTVGDLKKLLNDLPDELRIEASFGDNVCLVVYNTSEKYHKPHEAHLRFFGDVERDEDANFGEEE